MDEKPPVERRERKKKGERKSKRRDDEDLKDNLGGDARPMAASKATRSSGSTRSESPQMDMPSAHSTRPSSSHRRGGEFEKERVVRETVSFTKAPPNEPAQKPKPAPTTKKAPVADDDDYDDDFEDYADDFEDDEDPSPAPAPKPSGVIPKLSMAANARTDDDMKALRQSMQQENSLAMEHESKGGGRERGESKAARQAATKPSAEAKDSAAPAAFSKDTPPPTDTQTATSRRKKSGGLMGFSKGNTMTLGPRMKRLQRLRESGVLDMQDDKALTLNIMPCTPFEVYHRQVFSQSPSVRQMGVPVEQNTRDMEVQSEEITMADKEVQFVYGDDTSLINAMKRVVARRNGQAISDLEDENQVTKDKTLRDMGGDVNVEGDVVNENRLNSFLQAAAQLCEDILNEGEAVSKHSNGRSQRGMPTHMFSSDDSDWQSLGGDGSDGSNELVRNRPVSAVTFSSLQPHLLMTAHPYDEADEEDLRPFKGIYCIWSTSSPGAPSVVLEGSGQPTCCSFSASQTFIVISGTAEGTLHLWDLRESNSLHASRDTIDLRIAKGLRKPCYSTHTGTSTNTADFVVSTTTGKSKSHYGVNELEADQHSCPIVQVEAISGSGSGESAISATGVSQFISLETSGKAIIWAASHATATSTAGDNIDFGLSPWGKVKLTRQRVLYSSNASALDSIYPCTLSSLGIIPGDTSSFLIACGGGGHEGVVSRVVRYGSGPDSEKKAKSSQQYGRRLSSHVVVDSSSSGDSKYDDADPFAPVSGIPQLHGYTPPATCIAVSQSNASGDTSMPSLVLVGRCDGSLDLYSIDAPYPIQSWTDLSSYADSKDSRSGQDPSAIVSAEWMPLKSSVAFVVADAVGRIYYFDLMKDADRPLYVESVKVTALLPNTVKLSSCRSVGGSVFMAVGDVDMPVSSGRLRIRKLHEDLVWQQAMMAENRESRGGESKGEEKKSVDVVSSLKGAAWVGRTVAVKVVTEYRGEPSSDGKSRK